MSHQRAVEIALQQRAQAGRPTHPLVRAMPLRGAPVFGPTGDRVGRIWDVALDKHSGRAIYVILACGGVFGLGRRFRAVPWTLLRREASVGGREGGYAIPCDADDLDDARSFLSDELRSFAPPVPKAPPCALRPPSD